MKKYLKKNLIYINFAVAFLALIIAVPGGLNQLTQFAKELTETRMTEVLKFSPPNLEKSKAKSGRCWTNSIASTRTDAFRCSEENSIWDPCFLVGDYADNLPTSYVYCPFGWNSSNKDVTLSVNLEEVLHGESPLVATTSPKLEETDPWLVVFDDGSECRILTGTLSNAYNNLANIYGCSGKVVAVAEGKQSGDKFYFDCKIANEPYFKRCLAKQVVY